MQVWRGVACGVSTVVGLMALAPVAWADGSGVDGHTSCADASCEVTARAPGHVPAVPDAPLAESGAVNEASAPVCAVPDVEFAQSGQEGPHEIPPGMARCQGTASTGSEPVLDPVALAEQARAMMRLPEPDIGTAPTPGKPRFVNIPAWMWVSEEDWEPVSATASVSAGSVTVVASPERVVWDTGDGHEVVCTGPGTVFSRATAGEGGSPDCGHIYTALPVGGAGAAVDLTAVWEWGVSWSSSDGQGGDLEELTTTSTVAVPVSEIHSVVTHIR